MGAIRPTKGVPRGEHAIQGASEWDSNPGPAARKSGYLTTTPESLAQQGQSDNDRVRGGGVTDDNTGRNFAHRDLSRFSTELAEIRGARSPCNPLSDVLRFARGDDVFGCVFLSARRGAVRDRLQRPGKNTGRSRGKQASPTSNRGSLERARRKTRIAADGQHRDAPQGEHGGVLYAGRVVTDDGCTGSHSPNKDENERQGERLNARKAHHRIRHRILCKMVGLVGRWVPSVARTTEIRVRTVVVVAPSAGGVDAVRWVHDTKNDKKKAPSRTDCTSTDSASNSLQDAVVFVRLSVSYAENDRFSCLPRVTRSLCSRAERCAREIRGVLAPQRLRVGG